LNQNGVICVQLCELAPMVELAKDPNFAIGFLEMLYDQLLLPVNDVQILIGIVQAMGQIAEYHGGAIKIHAGA
jgi:hypothetical protein